MPLKLASFALGKTLLLKILNVSERTRMSVVLHSSEFAVRKLVVEQRTRRYSVQQVSALFLFTPRIYLAYCQKRWRYGASTSSHHEKCTFVYFSTDVLPCTSVEDKFCAQNLLLINFPPIRGRSDGEFWHRQNIAAG